MSKVTIVSLLIVSDGRRWNEMKERANEQLQNIRSKRYTLWTKWKVYWESSSKFIKYYNSLQLLCARFYLSKIHRHFSNTRISADLTRARRSAANCFYVMVTVIYPNAIRHSRLRTKQPQSRFNRAKFNLLRSPTITSRYYTTKVSNSVTGRSLVNKDTGFNPEQLSEQRNDGKVGMEYR